VIFRFEETLPILINIGLIIVGVPIIYWLLGAVDPTCGVTEYQPQLILIMILVAIQPAVFILARMLKGLSVRKDGF